MRLNVFIPVQQYPEINAVPGAVIFESKTEHGLTAVVTDPTAVNWIIRNKPHWTSLYSVTSDPEHHRDSTPDE